MALTAISTSNDPEEKKRLLCRKVCHLDHDLWQKEWKYIVLRGILGKFSQNEEIRLTLALTVDSRIAEVSPHDHSWGIGLSACDQRVSFPDIWCRQNQLGQALLRLEEIRWHPNHKHPSKP